jgi:hypothetical protein
MGGATPNGGVRPDLDGLVLERRLQAGDPDGAAFDQQPRDAARRATDWCCGALWALWALRALRACWTLRNRAYRGSQASQERQESQGSRALRRDRAPESVAGAVSAWDAAADGTAACTSRGRRYARPGTCRPRPCASAAGLRPRTPWHRPSATPRSPQRQWRTSCTLLGLLARNDNAANTQRVRCFLRNWTHVVDEHVVYVRCSAESASRRGDSCTARNTGRPRCRD